MSDALLTDNDRQSALSKAYASAVAAIAGYTTSVPDIDRDSVDLEFKAGGVMRPNLHAQLKATFNLRKSGDQFKFQLSKKNYNDLRCPTQVPRILIVLGMPKKEVNWLNITAARLIIRRCAYWASLLGLPDLPDSQESKIVEIPVANRFDVDALKDLMEKSRKGIPL